MAEHKRPLLANIVDQVGSLKAELGEMLALRWELARLECQADLRSARRLAVVLLVGVLMALTSLPVLIVFLAGLLDGWLGVTRQGWLLILALGLLLGAGVVSYLAWRRFRRRFVGLEETIEELREDMVWLREWIAR
jgi:uncharacterized membrane protein (DUF485 family)